MNGDEIAGSMVVDKVPAKAAMKAAAPGKRKDYRLLRGSPLPLKQILHT